MSEIEEKNQINKTEETRARVNKIGRIMFYVTIVTVWVVAAVLGIRDIWRDVGILETPWIIFGLVLSVVLVIIVVVPLYKNLKKDVRKYKEEKEKEKQL